MNLILLNLQSNQQIKLDQNNPFIIGRGNVEGCFDKRVSRNHGRISCTLDGKILLAALHCNPCFFTRSGLPSVIQLNKDEEATLNEGDSIGLLPHAFWFKITSNAEAKIKKEADSTRPDLTSDENNRTGATFENSSISVLPEHESLFKEGSICTPRHEQNEDNFNKSLVSTSDFEHKQKFKNSPNSPNKFGTPEFEKTRLLPLSMYEIKTPVQFPCKSPNKRSLSSDTKIKGKKHRVFPDIKDEVESYSRSETVIEMKNEVTTLDIPSTSKVENIDESSKYILYSESKLPTISNTEEQNREANKKAGFESHTDNSEDNAGKRLICQYESSCYRQNPQHKLEFCHPGDSDYLPYELRPLCQYGAACYRRNERHRVQFRHPPSCSSSLNNSSPSSCSRCSIASSPLPAKRRRKKIQTQNLDFEDDDEYDLEDPFINDASSDEYVPSDVDSEEKEDFDESQENY